MGRLNEREGVVVFSQWGKNVVFAIIQAQTNKQRPSPSFSFQILYSALAMAPSYPITTQNKVEYRAQDVEFEFSCVDGRRQRIYVPDNED